MIPGFENILGIEEFGDYPKNFQIGSFIFYEDKKELYFQDATQKIHDISKIFLLSSKWNFSEGDRSFPKPFIFGSGGEIKDYGAYCLYAFVNDTLSNIVIFGQVVNPNFDSPDDLLDFKTNDLSKLLEEHKVRNNEKRYFSVTDDGKGNLIVVLQGKENNGNFYLKLIGDDNQVNGNVKVELNGKYVLNQVTDEGEVFAQILMDNTSGDEKIQVKDKHKNYLLMNKTGTVIETPTIRIGKEKTVKMIFDDLINAILNMSQQTAAGGPTIPQSLFNKAEFEAIKTKLTQIMDVQ